MDLLFWVGLTIVLGNLVFSGIETILGVLKEICEKFFRR